MGKSMQQLAVCFTNNSSLSKSLNLVVDEKNKTQLIYLLQNCSWNVIIYIEKLKQENLRIDTEGTP